MVNPSPAPLLDAESLADLARGATATAVAGSSLVPTYDRSATTIGVVHLGVGNFFRAHQAVYLDDALAAGETGWAACGVSLRSPETRDALQPQAGLYTVIERAGETIRPRIIGALRELLVAPEDPAAVVARIAAPTTRWVTLTITEKGYGHAAGLRLDSDRPDIAHDIANPAAPRSAVGLLHRALTERAAGRLPGLTLLSCDNLSANGHLLHRLLLDFDEARGRPLGAWLEDEIRCPDTMVDRIVPRTTDADRALAVASTGLDDRWPIVTEPFRQWVIQDHFLGPRPELERSGVQIVTDVAPYENMKLRLLNAAHSALAWLGMPAGLATVDQAIAAPALRRYIEDLWQREIIPTLPAAIAAESPAYCAALLDRFANPGLAHRTAQIAMDGSQKFPLRILPSVRKAREQGRDTTRLTLIAAAWARYLAGRDEQGASYPPEDPLAAELQRRANQGDAARVIHDIFTLILPDEPTTADPGWIRDAAAALTSLRAGGTQKVLEEVNAKH